MVRSQIIQHAAAIQLECGVPVHCLWGGLGLGRAGGWVKLRGLLSRCGAGAAAVVASATLSITEVRGWRGCGCGSHDSREGVQAVAGEGTMGNVGRPRRLLLRRHGCGSCSTGCSDGPGLLSRGQAGQHARVMRGAGGGRMSDPLLVSAGPPRHGAVVDWALLHQLDRRDHLNRRQRLDAQGRERAPRLLQQKQFMGFSCFYYLE